MQKITYFRKQALTNIKRKDKYSREKYVLTRSILYKKQSILDTSLDFTTYKKRVTSLLLQ